MVLLIIGGISAYKQYTKTTPEEKTMRCIANGAVLYSKTTCVFCKQQKEILGQYISFFKIIECDEAPEICQLKQITGTPNWEINEKFYRGVKSIKELADLVGCECNANINVVKNSSETCSVEDTNKTCTTEVQTICTE